LSHALEGSTKKKRGGSHEKVASNAKRLKKEEKVARAKVCGSGDKRKKSIGRLTPPISGGNDFREEKENQHGKEA